MCNSFFVGERRYLESMPVTPSLRSRAGSEPIRFAQGKLREGAGSTGGEILRSAQDDSPDPSPVRFREPFSPNISSVSKMLVFPPRMCYDKGREDYSADRVAVHT